MQRPKKSPTEHLSSMLLKMVVGYAWMALGMFIRDAQWHLGFSIIWMLLPIPAAALLYTSRPRKQRSLPTDHPLHSLVEQLRADPNTQLATGALVAQLQSIERTIDATRRSVQLVEQHGLADESAQRNHLDKALQQTEAARTSMTEALRELYLSNVAARENDRAQ